MNLYLRLSAALAAGTLFGLGLAIAQMIDPAKVINFLNIFGPWDPSLMFVMGGGLAVNSLLTWFILKRKTPLLAEFFQLPSKTQFDRRIVIGGVIFGIGWGLAGYCPGPMFTSLSFVDSDILTVIGSFVVGTFGSRWFLANRRQSQVA